MNLSNATRSPTAAVVFSAWIDTFSRANSDGNARNFARLFAPDGHWKDMLAYSWSFPTFSGQDEIADAYDAYRDATAVSGIQVAADRTPPRFVKRSGRELIEGYFDFNTKDGRGTGYVRLLRNHSNPLDTQVWQLLTTLQELRGFEERTGAHRPTGNEFAKNTLAGNWQDRRDSEVAFAKRDPQVVIIGAGHSGLSLAARFRHMGVDALVVETSPRVGDVWRRRYHSLTLHNQVFANHMPFMPFPDTWHVWLPKDKLAGWLEIYAQALELNVWVETEVVESRFDDVSKLWTVQLKRGDGTERTIRCPHLVMATGVSGSIPKIPALPGIENFDGKVVHSSQFSSGAAFAGKRALVVGTGNSGHDVAQDFYVNGASQVTMLQRGPSCVVSLEPTAISIYSVYGQGLPVEDVDLATSAIPYPVLRDTYQWLTKKARLVDKDLIESLNAVGFETNYGTDDTGFHMMYLRGQGGYYINVGCSDLIRDGKVDVLQYRDIAGFAAEGLQLKNGEVLPFDVVVLATGFNNMQENVRRLMGSEVADRIGPIWGFDESYSMRNMWRPTAQEAFWVMGGGLIDARLFSRFLALQIAAALAGMDTQRAAPMRKSNPAKFAA
jgi:cation diffusion facilitator CzcD-associated flavoprotein CzcO